MKISKLYEFSVHCIRDLSCCLADHGFLVQRIFFKTLHAKGEQEASEANVKKKASHAVLKKTVVIRNAKDMLEYLEENSTALCIQQPLHLHQDPRYWVSLVGCSFTVCSS